MNEQVRKYFDAQKLLSECIVLEAVGTELKMYINRDDINFVHQVRILYKRQGNPEESLPTYHRILAAKYALLVANPGLHPPLHNYKKQWNGERLDIYETNRRGGGWQFQDDLLGEIDQYTFALFRKATGRVTEDKDEVADWWMEENKNAIHDYAAARQPPSKGGTKGTLPRAIVKITDFHQITPNAETEEKGMGGWYKVSLAFRRVSKGAGSTYGWHEVKDIHINLDRFRNKADEEGFRRNVHDSELLKYKSWEKVLEPKDVESKEIKGKNGSRIVPTDDPADTWRGERRSKIKKGHKGYISPGSLTPSYNPSNVYGELLKKHHQLSKRVNEIVAQVTASALNRTESWGVFDYATIKDIMQDTYVGLYNVAGEVPDELWEKWEHWIDNVKADVGADDYKRGEDVNRWLRESAHRIALREISKRKKERGKEKSGFGKANDERGGDFMANQAGKSQTPAIDYSSVVDGIVNGLSDEEALKDDPGIITRIRALTQQKPVIATLLKKRGIDLDQLAAKYEKSAEPAEPTSWQDLMGDDDDDDDSPGSYGRYDRMKSRYESFQDYIKRRTLSEMSVAWGNDKASAKKLRPGQTLKGGIQVFGAPWTAGGGPNNNDNDIKIKG